MGFGAGTFGSGPFGASTPGGGPTGPAPQIVATLIGDPRESPRRVLVTVNRIPVGKTLTVTGHDTRGGTWLVRGSGNVTTSTQAILGDIRTPTNTPIWYEFTAGDQSGTSEQIVVPARDHVLQTVDGRLTVPFWWIDNDDPREQTTRQALYPVAGRARPVGRIDSSLEDDGVMLIHTVQPHTDTLREIIRDGGLAIVRTAGPLHDLPASDVILIRTAPRRLSGGYRKDDQGKDQNARAWTLGWTSFDDPEPGTVIPTATEADFDAVWAGMTEADFDAAWAGQTEADFDTFDWAGEAAQ